MVICGGPRKLTICTITFLNTTSYKCELTSVGDVQIRKDAVPTKSGDWLPLGGRRREGRLSLGSGKVACGVLVVFCRLESIIHLFTRIIC